MLPTIRFPRPFLFAFGVAGMLVTGIPLRAGSVIITGVFDGPLTGGLPKGIELYVAADVPDLAVYGLESANNGGGASGAEFTFPSGSASAGTFLYVATEAGQFEAFFGFAPDFTSGFASINGDDAILLYENGMVADVFGDPDVDGSGQAWEYTDSWAYRQDGTGPDPSGFVPGSWFFGGVDALDGVTSNAAASTPIPIGTYARMSCGNDCGPAIPEPGRAMLGMLGLAVGVLIRRRARP